MSRTAFLRFVTVLAALSAAPAARADVLVQMPTGLPVAIEQVDTANLEITLRAGGKEIVLTDTKSKQQVVLTDGVLEQKLSDDEDGLTVASDQFTLKQNGRKLAVVSRQGNRRAVCCYQPANGIGSQPAPQPEWGVTLDTPTGMLNVGVAAQANVELVIRNGNQVVLRDGSSKKEIPLVVPQERKLGDGLEASLERYALKRGGKPVVEVTFQRNNAPAAPVPGTALGPVTSGY